MGDTMNEMQEIGNRLRLLREGNDVPAEDMAYELHVDTDTYLQWEATGEDVPISALYHISKKFGIEFNEIITGESEKLRTYQVVRAGDGKEVDRYPGYVYEDLAWRFSNKMLQPLLVSLEPGAAPVKPASHSGQEFNYVLEGTVVLEWGDKTFELNRGDSVYFNPTMPHAQKCGGDKPARLIVVITE